MAESYRGLTIKIGGDTTKLTHALHAANQAIAGTQSELRKLSTAARLDPSSFKAASLQMGAMAEQASNTATKLLTLNNAIKQLGSEDVTLGDGSVTNLKKMVEEARNVQIQVALMREGFNGANAALEKSYRQLTQWSQEFGSGKIFNVVNDNTDLEKLEEEFKKLKDEISDFSEEDLKLLGIDVTKEQLDEALESMKRLKEESVKFGSALEDATKGARFQDLEAEAAKTEASVTSLVNKLVEANENSYLAEAMGEVSGELSIVERSIKSAKDRIKELDQALKLDPKNEELLAERMLAVKDGAAAAQQKVQILNDVLSKLKAKGLGDATKSTKELTTNAIKAAEQFRVLKKQQADFDAQLNETKRRLNEMEVILAKNPDAVNEQGEAYSEMYAALNKAYEMMKAEVNSFDKEVDESSENMKNAYGEISFRKVSEEISAAKVDVEKFGNTPVSPKVDQAAFVQAVNMIGQAARRVASEVVQSANEIDSAYRDMRKTVNGTDRQFEELKQEAIEYSQTHFTSAETMLEMQALGGQLGILIEDLGKFGEISSNLDIATDIGAEDIALQLGQMGNVLQMDIDDMEGFSDALVRLGNNMPAQESRIMNVAQRFAAVASTANFSGDEILAWSAAIASTGQRSEAAATAIGNTVSGIEQAIANGGNDLKQFAAIANMSASEFSAAWKDDPTQALKAFIQGLNNLKESDESAVAALENMGITGVRQQQTLLGLSQTIGNLDNALMMSKDAWNGISDQWGQAGDAAIEAENKSKGFSGALAILQNNVKDLASVFGDTLVPVMNMASSIIATVTDVLLAMPAPLKAIAVGTSTAMIAFKTVIPVIQVFSKTLKQISAASAASSLSGFISNLLNLTTAAPAAAAATEGVAVAAEGTAAATGAATASFGPWGIAIAAVVAALGALWTAYEDYRKQQETLEQATNGLRSSMDGLNDAYDEWNEKAKNTTMTISELKDRFNELTEAQANLAEKLRSDWEEVGTQEAVIDSLTERIGELARKSSLTADEQAELIAAVDSFNTMTGNSVQVLDQETGKISETTSAINGMARAWKESTESDTSLSHYNDLLEQQVYWTKYLEDAQSRLGDSTQETNDWFVDMRTTAYSASTSVGNFSSEVEKAQGELDAVNKQLEEERSKLIGLSRDLSGVEDALSSYGKSLGDYGDFTEEELGIIVAAFNDTSDSSVSALKRIENAIEGIYNARDEAARASADAIRDAEKLYKETQKQYDKDYKAAKKKYDNRVKAAQRGLDAEYKAQQRAFDAAYKGQQKAYDAEYKALQKAYDNEYKAAQKAYEANYKEWQKYYDDIYKSLQKELDKEYKAQQKAYEEEYEALQKAFSVEYDARKKQYDAQLKALKKAQDAEVDTFDKATDAKLKDMEREYKKRLKLLELEYGGKNSDLDEQIKQLESETEAEKKAIEERNENDKKAELERAVQQAKSRRTRAEAEKALTDYLQEIEQKRNEESRSAEIERIKEKQDALKEDLETQKELLKEQYDSEVEAYKERRNQELEALKEANEVEYEAKKEYYDLQLEQLKESQTAYLESVKEQQQAELDSIKESQQANLDALKEAQQANLEAMKESQQESLESLKQSQQDELEAMKQDHQDKIDKKKEHYQKLLDDLKEKQKEELELIKSGNRDTSDEMDKAAEDMGEKGKKGRTLYEEAIGPMPDGSLMNAKKTRQNMVSELNEGWKEVETIGADTGNDYNSGLMSGFGNAISTTSDTANQMTYIMQGPGETSEVSGSDFMSNFISGVVSTWNVYGVSTFMAILQWIADHWAFSVPDKGPLHHQDEWGGHFMDNLIDGMRDKEGELYKQVNKMARAVEEGFDPTLSVDAAYDAIDSINRNRAKSAAQAASYAGDKNTSIEVNVNLSNVSLRSDADIEKLANEVSQRMAAQVRRQQAGRL